MPCIRKEEGGFNLYVDEKPFFILGGELHNSSSSSLQYMEEEVWPFLQSLHLNTVLLALAWECVEPKEGEYDFSLLEGLLKQARRQGVHLVLLWFGLWKNGESFYVPGWMRADCRRFFRAEYEGGIRSNTISPFCGEAVLKDQEVFCRLMEYLKGNDQERTVIMVQVENEIGFLKAERDFSSEAEKQYGRKIPDTVSGLYHVNGNWEEAFGEDAPEYFMAYHYACAVEKIASAGKRVYPLPLYVNAWLEQHPDRPGSYPSGGPVAKLMKLWRKAAPSVDMISPDIYLPGFKEVCENYCAPENPLFIPEAVRSPVTAANVLYAFSGLNALGFSPFGIEDICRDHTDKMSQQQLKELNIDAQSFYDAETERYLARSYQVLEQTVPLMWEYRKKGRLRAFIRQSPCEDGCIIPAADYDIQLDYIQGTANGTGSAGFLFLEDDGFYITGCNFSFHVLPKKGGRTSVGIPRYEEGAFIDGKWCRKRILNGDEGYRMTIGGMVETRYVKVYGYARKWFGRI